MCNLDGHLKLVLSHSIVSSKVRIHHNQDTPSLRPGSLELEPFLLLPITCSGSGKDSCPWEQVSFLSSSPSSLVVTPCLLGEGLPGCEKGSCEMW